MDRAQRDGPGKCRLPSGAALETSGSRDWRKRKVAAKKTVRKAAKVTGPAAYKFPKADKTRAKGQIMGQIAEKTGLTRKQVVSVFDAMTAMLTSDLKSGPKSFSLAGLAKFTVQYKPATKAR